MAHSEATRAKIAATLRGRKVSETTRANIAAAHADFSDEKNPNWGGDDVGYTGVHRRALKALAGESCAHTDGTCKGQLEIALRHDAPAEFLEVSPRGRVYSTRTLDYFRLCRSHHRRYDFANRRARTSQVPNDGPRKGERQ